MVLSRVGTVLEVCYPCQRKEKAEECSLELYQEVRLKDKATIFILLQF